MLASLNRRRYITGRSEGALKEACESVPGPGKCIARVVDSATDASLEAFFSEVGAETGGQLDILVNNAYAGIGNKPPICICT